jgi:hypothetical protein
MAHNTMDVAAAIGIHPNDILSDTDYIGGF